MNRGYLADQRKDAVSRLSAASYIHEQQVKRMLDDFCLGRPVHTEVEELAIETRDEVFEVDIHNIIVKILQDYQSKHLEAIWNYIDMRSEYSHRVLEFSLIELVYELEQFDIQ